MASPSRSHRPNPAAIDGPTGADQPRITHAMEDYLKAVYRLHIDGGAVTTQRLAEELGISGPSVTNMVKRLDEMKLLEHTRYHGVVLTAAGERVALEVLRHHRLLEAYLTETLGFPWDEVHAEAERLEHMVSDELERRIDRALGHPSFDPHGEPIPAADGTMPRVSNRRLIDLAVGESGIVERVSDRNPEQLRYLGSLGLTPGTRVEVRERLPFDGPIRIGVDDEEHVIGTTLARIVHIVAGKPDTAAPETGST